MNPNAMTFPRDMTTAHAWASADFRLQRRQEMSREAGGRPIVADLGPPIWRADFRSKPLDRDSADALFADFGTLGGALRPFFAHPAERPRPTAAGGASGLNLGVVSSISTDRQRVRLAGLPAGLDLRPGDYLSISTAAGGLEFLQLASGGVAGGDGITPSLTVTQPIRPSVADGQGVSLSPPLIEMHLAPGSLGLERIGGRWQALTFSAWQRVR